MAVVRPIVAEAPFCEIFIGLRREAAIDTDDEVDGRS